MRQLILNAHIEEELRGKRTGGEPEWREKMDEVYEFKYLGSVFWKDGRME